MRCVAGSSFHFTQARHGGRDGTSGVKTGIVLAGGRADEVAALDPLAPNKAFVRVQGRALVTRTIDALREASVVETIVAVCPQGTAGHPALAGADEWRASGDHIAESLRAGLRGFPVHETVLIAAADLPILSPSAVRDFAQAAVADHADVVYSCVERRVHEAAFPDVPHTWAHLSDGDYCGGGLIALRPRVLPALERFLDRLGSARKNPLRLASIFGARVLVRYALRRLSIADAERRAERLVHARVRAFPSMHPEIAVNVDRPGDLALAELLVRERTLRDATSSA